MYIYVGKEYIEDEKKDPVIIRYHLLLTWNINEFSFSDDYGQIKCYNDKGLINVDYEITISHELIEDAISTNKGIGFLKGYFVEILNHINRELYHQKYLRGYLLIRPVSFRDIFIIELIRDDKTSQIPCLENQAIIIDKSIDSQNDYVFLRDFIDSMTAFLNNNFEDCIRLLITSLENYPPFREKSGKFKRKLETLCNEINVDRKGCTTNRQIINANAWFLYQTRNNIVHDKLKVDFDCSWNELGEKGVATINYIYMNHIKNKEIIDYLNSLGLEFVSIKGLNKINNLDVLEAEFKTYKENYNEP